MLIFYASGIHALIASSHPHHIRPPHLHNRQMPRTPSLDALRIFAVAARHLSFTEAASELNLTQSAVSHRIRGLEEELGLRCSSALHGGSS